MGTIRTDNVSFSGGEITPEMYGRQDDSKYQSGLALARNFIIKPWGPAANRAGTKYVSKVKFSTKRTRLIPFTYSTTQTMAIEVGEQYFRFHTGAATLLVGTAPAWNSATAYSTSALVANGGVNYYAIADNINQAPPNATYWYAMPSTGEYEIPHSYLEADLFDIHYVQSSDVLSLVHPNYPPQELRRLGATQWKMNLIQTSPTIAAPAAPSGSGTPVTQSYQVTATRQVVLNGITTMHESAASTTATASNDLTLNGHSNLITWAPVSNAGGYRIYKLVGSTYSYLGVAQTTTFTDDGSANPITTTVAPTATDSFITSPTSVTATANATSGVVTVTATTNSAPAGGLTSTSYVVTSVSADGTSESLASSVGSATNNLLFTGAFNTISWPSVQGASSYNVYKLSGGLYGYIGQTTSTSIIDNDILPDISKTPPLVRAPFVGLTNYPGAISYFEQRRCLAGTLSLPQNIWMTRSGTESDLSYRLPSRDDDAIAFRVAAREANTIRHIVPLIDLILLTSAAEWRVTSLNSDALTPTSISVKPQSYIGASNVQPEIVNNNLVYAAARGGHMRELAYSWQANGYVTGDLAWRAPHLFDGFTLVDMAYVKAPFPIVWACSSNGSLLGCTYVPEQQVGPWHHHDSYTKAGQSLFESCAVVAEGNVDVTYLIVNRVINGQQVRLVEWMGDRAFIGASNAYFVDCGATYNGTATTTVTGLTWLEGETVNILADGAVSPPQVVTGGVVTVPVAASVIQVGLQITSDLMTLPISFQTQGYGQGREKNVNKAWVRVLQSSGIQAGPDFSSLTPYAQRTTETYGAPPALVDGEVDILLSPEWAAEGSLCIRQTDPSPLIVSSMCLELSIGA